MSKIKKGTDGINLGTQEIIKNVESSITKISASTSESSDTTKNLTALGTATETTIYKLNATKTALEKTVNSMEESEEKTVLLSQISSLDKQITELKTNVATERTAYNKVIKEETKEVLTGLNQLKTALGQLQGVSSQVKNGVDTIISSSPELQNGLNKLEDGSSTLSKGANALSAGTNTLSNGAKELKTGIETLNSNTETIKEAGIGLKDGAKTISDGANTLADGMNKFDNDGISKIYKLVNGDIKGIQNKAQKLIDLSKKSNSYKYILKVDSIK